ncbi:TspO/MBR family protein [Mycobacterium botniense]|uniref:TspO/MBR family protein n=1 Tax=Mycobacterium botniense TaxID=84962 RepID=UPI0013D38475|nr:TspO/MBR family protein [Mycobacterium botniense]
MRLRTVIATATSAAAAAAVGSLASQPVISSSWYVRLRKPAYQPPRIVFPLVWSALYADIALISAATIDELHYRQRSVDLPSYRRALALNLVLNAGWSWFFFNRHALGASAAAAAALTASSADLARRSIAVGGAGAAPLALYPMWCAFASVLSTHIWLLNRRRKPQRG